MVPGPPGTRVAGKWPHLRPAGWGQGGRGLWLLCTWAPARWEVLDLLAQGHSILVRHAWQACSPAWTPRLWDATTCVHPGPSPALPCTDILCRARACAEARRGCEARPTVSALLARAPHVRVHRGRSDGTKERGGWDLAESRALCVLGQPPPELCSASLGPVASPLWPRFPPLLIRSASWNDVRGHRGPRL